MSVGGGFLTGFQLKLLREAVAAVFPDGYVALNQFLKDNNFGPLNRFASDTHKFPIVVGKLIEESYATGDLTNILDAVQRNYPRAPSMVGLREKLELIDTSVEKQRIVRQFDSLEAIVSGSSFKNPLSWSEQLLTRTSAICRVSAGKKNGTGFLVAEDMILTAYHVVEGLLAGHNLIEPVGVEFGYVQDSAGRMMNVQTTAERCILSQSYSQTDLRRNGNPDANELDFALLSLAAPVDANRAPVDIKAAPPRPKSKILFVLQHPLGNMMQMSVGCVLASDIQHRLRYDADTYPGSSGGLVLDEDLAPVGMHHFGDPGTEFSGGYNQCVPLKEVSDAITAA